MTATSLSCQGARRAVRPAISSDAEILKFNLCSENTCEKLALRTSVDLENAPNYPSGLASPIVAHIHEQVFDLLADGLLDRHTPKDRLGVVAATILQLPLVHRRTK
jgi:hypothetical protein